MPYVVNGIGTWYSGKRNISVRRGTCTICGCAGDLRSYDTTLFFVVVFIPLIPLKRLRILDDCPACRKHQAVPLARWQKRREEELALVLEAVQSRPDDPAAAMTAIGVAISLRDEQAFLGLAELIEPTAANNADVQAALGEGYEFFGQPTAAIQAYRRSLALKPDPNVQTQLGAYLLRRGNVNEGWPLVEFIFDQKIQERGAIGFLAAEAFQAAGQHQQALDLLARMEESFPAFKKSPDIKRMRAASNRNLASGKPIKSARIGADAISTSSPKVTERPWMARLPWLIGPTLAVMALIFWCMVASTKGNSRPAYIVNGSSRPYQVQVNGAKFLLQPYQPRKINIKEGTIAIKVLTPEAHIPDQTCVIQTSFWLRPVDAKTFVINPDQLAVLSYEETEYVPQNVSRQSTFVHEVQRPALLHDFADLHYVMQDFPQSLQMKGNTPVRRRRVDVQPLAIQQAVTAIAQTHGDEAVMEFLRRGLAEEPHVEEYPAYLVALGHAGDVAKALRAHLAARPLLLPAHRAYQDATERSDPAYDLKGEYQRWLSAEPTNSALQYLTGRVVNDRVEAERRWHQCLSDPEVGGYAASALAFNLISDARFEEALTLIRAATNGGGAARPRLQDREIEALCGLGRLEDALKTEPMTQPVASMPPHLFVQRACLLVQTPGKAAVEPLIDEFAGPESDSTPEEPLGEWRAWLRGQLAYVQGNSKPLADLGAAGQTHDIHALILAGRFDEADKQLDEPGPSNDPSRPLTLAIAARLAHKQTIADHAFAKAAAIFADGNFEQRKVAAWVSGAHAPAPGEAPAFTFPLDDKCLLLAAVALQHPDRRDECVAMLGKLNIDRRPPYLLLAQLIGQPAESADSSKPPQP